MDDDFDEFDGFGSEEEDIVPVPCTPPRSTGGSAPDSVTPRKGISRGGRQRMSGAYGFSGSFGGGEVASVRRDSFEFHAFDEDEEPAANPTPDGGTDRQDTLSHAQRSAIRKKLLLESEALDAEAAQLEHEVLSLAADDTPTVSPDHSRSSSPKHDVLMEDEEDAGADLPGPAQQRVLPGGSDESRPAGHTEHALTAVTVTYLGSAFSPRASLKAAAEAWQDVQSPDIATFKQAAEFTILSSGVVSVTTPAPSSAALFAAPAVNISMAVQIPAHADTVAMFSKDPNLNFMVCHLVQTNSASAAIIVDKLGRLIADTDIAIRRMSVSGPASTGGRQASVRFAKKTAVVAGNGKRMYSIKRRTKDAKRTNKGLASSAGGTTQVSSADLAKPIGMFKIGFLGSIGADKEKGTDVATAAINKFVTQQLDQGITAPTPGALGITLSGFTVVELASSEELSKVFIQNVSFVSIVEARSDLEPLKALGYKGWDRPLLVVTHNKSKITGKRIPEAQLIVLEKGAKPKEVLKLLKGAAAAAATRHHNRQNAFDADPNADSSQEVFLGGALKEIERESLDCLKVLGKGEYGEVFLAKWTDRVDRADNKVAVKLANAHVSLKEAGDFLGEAEIMAPLQHVNIVNLLGVAVRQKPWLIVLEYCNYGDLAEILKSCRRLSNPVKFTNVEQLYCSYQVAAALDYISSKRLIHLDVAARNCLVQNNTRIKVADFGVAQTMDKGKAHWQQTVNMKLPGRWLAPEALQISIYSAASDCWAFGTTMWEIASYGQLPFKNVRLPDIREHVIGGGRNPQPPECDDAFYAMMMRCWAANHRDRPPFSQLCCEIQDLGDMRLAEGQLLRDIGKVVAADKPVTETIIWEQTSLDSGV